MSKDSVNEGLKIKKEQKNSCLAYAKQLFYHIRDSSKYIIT